MAAAPAMAGAIAEEFALDGRLDDAAEEGRLEDDEDDDDLL